MKNVTYSSDALKALARHRNVAAQIMAKIVRYAKSGAGDVTQLVGAPDKRLRVGEFRVVFNENATSIIVLQIGPRSSIYN